MAPAKPSRPGADWSAERLSKLRVPLQGGARDEPPTRRPCLSPVLGDRSAGGWQSLCYSRIPTTRDDRRHDGHGWGGGLVGRRACVGISIGVTASRSCRMETRQEWLTGG